MSSPLVTGPLTKIAAPTAAEVCALFEASPEARALLRPDLRPAAFLAELLATGLHSDAVRFLAFGLPKRQGAWWACLAARDALAAPGAPPPAPDLVACVEAAEKWVFKPTEELRQSTLVLAQKIGFDSAAAYAGLAVHWSGGSLVPPDLPPVPPDDRLTPTAVAAAVLLAVTVGPPQALKERTLALLERAIHIANGGNGRPHGR